MRPRPITQADVDQFTGQNPRVRMFTTPAELDAGIEPCAGVVTDDVDSFGPIVHVPWTLDEIELTELAKGGTLWLSTWGGLPVHALTVQSRRPAGE